MLHGPGGCIAWSSSQELLPNQRDLTRDCKPAACTLRQYRKSEPSWNFTYQRIACGLKFEDLCGGEGLTRPHCWAPVARPRLRPSFKCLSLNAPLAEAAWHRGFLVRCPCPVWDHTIQPTNATRRTSVVLVYSCARSNLLHRCCWRLGTTQSQQIAHGCHCWATAASQLLSRYRQTVTVSTQGTSVVLTQALVCDAMAPSSSRRLLSLDSKTRSVIVLSLFLCFGWFLLRRQSQGIVSLGPHWIFAVQVRVWLENRKKPMPGFSGSCPASTRKFLDHGWLLSCELKHSHTCYLFYQYEFLYPMFTIRSLTFCLPHPTFLESLHFMSIVGCMTVDHVIEFLVNLRSDAVPTSF